MKIIVACGSGVATSTIIASRIEDLLNKNKIKVQIIQCSLQEVNDNLVGTSLVISSMPGLEAKGVPSIIALPYITGIGAEELDKKLLDILANVK
ncbi:MAG: PTS sugar transporter subunit IIB [Clostridia bacterium]